MTVMTVVRLALHLPSVAEITDNQFVYYLLPHSEQGDIRRIFKLFGYRQSLQPQSLKTKRQLPTHLSRMFTVVLLGYHNISYHFHASRNKNRELLIYVKQTGKFKQESCKRKKRRIKYGIK